MKLNYKPIIKKDEVNNKTKLSMQGLVTSLLASQQPQQPQQNMQQKQQQQGWGKNN